MRTTVGEGPQEDTRPNVLPRSNTVARMTLEAIHTGVILPAGSARRVALVCPCQNKAWQQMLFSDNVWARRLKFWLWA